jgi:hypothetical protein
MDAHPSLSAPPDTTARVLYAVWSADRVWSGRGCSVPVQMWEGVGPVLVQMWEGVGPVLVQMWHVRSYRRGGCIRSPCGVQMQRLQMCAQSRRRCGWRRCAPSPSADVAGAGPVPTLRRRCGRGESSPGADVGARLAHEVGAGKLLDELILLRLLVKSGEPCTARLVKRMHADIPGDPGGRWIQHAHALTHMQTAQNKHTRPSPNARPNARPTRADDGVRTGTQRGCTHGRL